MKPKKQRVVVAMSGGVDSSVAAALLVQKGYEVIGIMMRLWNEPGSEAANRCCTPEAMVMARRVSAQLGIQFYTVDAQEEFYTQVVKYFIDGYAQGITPNPCLECNRHIRWDFLLNRAFTLGADLFATGHYARLSCNDKGQIQLLEAVDRHKDQSYVLHGLSQEQLTHTLFPLGIYSKIQVREIARDFGLPVAERTESQDLCFLAGNDYRTFLMRHAPHVKHPGPILSADGRVLGEHHGLAFYTIGQRKGLGLPASHPLYVLDKDIKRNALIVGHKDNHGKKSLHLRSVNWVSGDPPSRQFRSQIKIRYKSSKEWGTVTTQDSWSANIHFDEPLYDISPGQAAVFYDGQVCQGGGII